MEREVLILVLVNLLYFTQFVRLFRKKKFGAGGISILLVLVSQQYSEAWGKASIIYTLILETVLLFWSVYNSKSFKEWKENQRR